MYRDSGSLSIMDADGSEQSWHALTFDLVEHVMSLLVNAGVPLRNVRLSCKLWRQSIDHAVTTLRLAGVPPDVSFLALCRSLERITLGNKTSEWTGDTSRACDELMAVLAKLPALKHLEMAWQGEDCLIGVGALAHLTNLKIMRDLGGDSPISPGETASMPASLSALQRLQELHLRNVSPEYTVLSGCAALVHLELEGQAVSSNSRVWRTTNTLSGIGASLGTQLTCLVARGNYGISRLPADMEALRGLVHLDLSRNMLWQLPAWLSSLQELTHLNVSANCLSELPEELGDLSGLQELDVSTNSRLRIPHTVSQLVSLRKLAANWIWSSVAVVLDAAEQLTALQELSLVGNGMAELPDSIGALTALTHLNVSMNALVSLPATIGRLAALRQLELSDNRLEALPPQLCSLSRLQSLAVRSNGLVTLPDSIGQLAVLTYLDCSMNKLAELPPSLSALASLAQLALSINPLRCLPPGLGGLPCLTMLELYYVQLDGLEGLEELRRALPRLFIFGAVTDRRGNKFTQQGEAPQQARSSSEQQLVLTLQDGADAMLVPAAAGAAPSAAQPGEQQQQQQQQLPEWGDEDEGVADSLPGTSSSAAGLTVQQQQQQQQQQQGAGSSAGTRARDGEAAGPSAPAAADDAAGPSAVAAAAAAIKRGRRATYYDDEREEAEDVAPCSGRDQDNGRHRRS